MCDLNNKQYIFRYQLHFYYIRDTKVTNGLTAHLSEIISSFTVKLSKINIEFNSKLIAEIENFKIRDAGYVIKAQKIFLRLNNIEEVHQNDFGRIRFLEKSVVFRFISFNASINNLQKKINQIYADAQSIDFDQYNVSNESEVSNRSRRSSNSTSSSSKNSPFSNPISSFSDNPTSPSSGNSSSSTDSSFGENKECFKRVFNWKKGEEDIINYIFETVKCEIHNLTGKKIGKETVKNFYHYIGDPKFRIVILIMRWIDNKENTGSLDNNNNVNSANNNE